MSKTPSATLVREPELGGCGGVSVPPVAMPGDCASIAAVQAGPTAVVHDVVRAQRCASGAISVNLPGCFPGSATSCWRSRSRRWKISWGTPMKKTNSAAVAKAKAVGYARVSTPEQAEKGSVSARADGGYSPLRPGSRAHPRERIRGARDHRDRRQPPRVSPDASRHLPAELGGRNHHRHARLAIHANATKARVHKEALRKRGIRVVAIQQEVSDDPNGRFAEGVFELIDQLESETNGVRACPRTRARGSSTAPNHRLAFALRRYPRRPG
jgi:hypothetical protein